MNRGISWLRNICLRQIVTVFLIAITFLAIPAFTNSKLGQAQAGRTQAEAEAKSDSYIPDKGTIKRVIDKAEDHVGDRPIGDTGLKNIKKLGENIPETAKEIIRQRFGNDQPGDVGSPDVVKGLKD